MPSVRAHSPSLSGQALASGSPVVEPGDTLAERYRLEREVGRTEAGAVFDGVDLLLENRVAVEVASSLEEPAARRQWARDAMLAQRLQGEHVLRVLDVGNLASGVPYAVRESALCTMSAEIEVKGALPIPLAVAWTLEACEAIAEAHALGMAHGDLRLDNIYLVGGTSAPSVKVAWTSAAKAERAAKEDVARDLAGLGAMLRVLSTGRLGDDEADGAPTLPSDLAHAVARSLSIDPRDKIQNITELARILAPYAPAGHPSARNVVLFMARAGIVANVPSAPTSSRRHSAIVPVVPALAVLRAAAPVSAAPQSDRASFTDEWFRRASHAPLAGTLAPMRRPARPRAFTFVSLALIAAALGGSFFLWENGQLPHWTGAAPPDAVGNTEVTSGPATPATLAEPAAAPAEPAAAPELPNAPPVDMPPSPLAAPTTMGAARRTAPGSDPPTRTSPRAAGLRYVDPEPTPAPTAPNTSPTPDDTSSRNQAAPSGDPTAAPTLGSPAPTTTTPEPAPQGPTF
jgi:hypothetical protein